MSIIQGNSKTSAAGGYTIDQSIRFNKDDDAKLTRTFGTATNRKIYTLSVWEKNGNSAGSLLEYNATAGVTWANITFGQDGRIDFFDYSGGSARIDLRTSAIFRDPSSWYHVVVAVDTTQATSTDRIKMYVNGVQITSFGTATYPSQNFDGFLNSAVSHLIGDGVNGPFDGYLAEYHFIDGQALDPTSFGETDATTGQWVPIAYSGSYGTNGFYITGENSASLGTDYSGNGNNFTSSGLTSADQVADTPTDNFCTLNPLITPVTMTFADGNLALSGYTAVTSAYGTFGMSSGKWYWELVAQANAMAGVAATPNGSQYPGQAADSYAFDLTNGTKYNNGSSSAFGAGAVSAGDTVGVAFDADNGDLKFYDNSGTLIGTAFTGLTSGPYFPVFRNGNAANISINFGQQAFSHSLPTSHVALSTANLINTTVTTSGSFTGNGSTDGPFVWLNGIPTAMTINGNSVTFATHADKLANGFKVRSSSASYNAVGSNTYSVATTAQAFKDANAQANP